MIALLVAIAAAAASPGSPAWAAQADVTEHLGDPVPLDAAFTDTRGAHHTLRDYVDGTHPLILVLAYYECPQLCSLVLDAAARAMRALGPDWRPGDRYRAVTISFDPGERVDQAARKQGAVADGLDWPFLVGDAPAIDRLTSALGYRFVRDPRTGVFAHPAVAFVLTPDGRISRYLYGIDYPPRDMKLALLEASDGKTGSFADRVLLRCFHYDPASHRYGPFIARFLRIGAALIFLVVVAMLVVLRRAERRRR